MGFLRRFWKQCVVRWQQPAHWHLRPGTIDRRLFRMVALQNEYRLPGRFSPDDVILDIGAHIGSFAYAVLKRGAGRVFCFEPDENNFRTLEQNLRPYGAQAVMARKAVWRSGDDTRFFCLENSWDRRNTGGFRLGESTKGQCVETVAFDGLVEEVAASSGGRIRLVKLDCEGAEWPILFSTAVLDRVSAICGEYHCWPLPSWYVVAGVERTPQNLKARLESWGFAVELQPSRERGDMGLFFGYRDAGSFS